MEIAELQLLTSRLHVLAHCERLRILALLVHHSCPVGAVAMFLGMRPAYVSNQLQTLKGVDLVRSHRQGKFMMYNVNKTVLTQVSAQVLELGIGWRLSSDAAGEVAPTNTD